MKNINPIKKTSLTLPLIGAGILAIALGSWTYFRTSLSKPEPVMINELTTTGSVSLSLSPASANLIPGQETTISLNINSGSDRLSFVKFELTYDPTKLTLTTPTLGTWLTKVLSPVTLTSGKLTAELGSSLDTTITGGGPEFNRTGSGTLLTFKAKGLVPGTYPITISATPSYAYTVGGTTATTASNMLKTVTGSSLIISNPPLVTDLVGTDHKVDRYDYVELINQYGKLPVGSADFNHSGAVDGADFALIVADYGKTW